MYSSATFADYKKILMQKGKICRYILRILNPSRPYQFYKHFFTASLSNCFMVVFFVSGKTPTDLSKTVRK